MGRSNVHLPKRASREGTNQREWLAARLRTARRLTLIISIAAGAAFTGLAVRHTLKPVTVQAQDVQTVSQDQSGQSQPVNVPSQSLFDNQTSSSFSIAPAPQVTQHRARSATS